MSLALLMPKILMINREVDSFWNNSIGSCILLLCMVIMQVERCL